MVVFGPSCTLQHVSCTHAANARHQLFNTVRWIRVVSMSLDYLWEQVALGIWHFAMAP